MNTAIDKIVKKTNIGIQKLGDGSCAYYIHREVVFWSRPSVCLSVSMKTSKVVNGSFMKIFNVSAGHRKK